MKYPKSVLKPVLEYLQHKKMELLRRDRNIKNNDPFLDESRVDDNAVEDDALEQYGHQQSEVLSKETEEALKKVQAAMDRIKSGTYGKCVVCGKMIDTDRLSIDPTAELCIECAKKQQKA